MKKLQYLFFLLMFLTLTSLLKAQELPPNFTFKRETGQTTGVPMFTLMVDWDAVAYDAQLGNGFEALCAIVQPERDKYGLMFINAKEKYQLFPHKNKNVEIKIDSEIIKLKNYIPNVRKKIAKLYVETATIVIEKLIYEKLIKAKDVLISVGIVKYSLDQDNIDAFRYFGSEIQKDLKRRNQ